VKTIEESPDEAMPANPALMAEPWHYLNKLPELLAPEVASRKVRILDLGAGAGQSRKIAREALGPGRFEWTGVDIGDSAEHLGRKPDAPPVDVYDGVNLPYADASFDVIWCKQVLEHVRQPDAVIAEVARCLRPGGLFIGSVSQLEPYHSRSIFNWTHYGIRRVLADHGLEVKELTPGVDGLVLIMRTIFGYSGGINKFFAKDSPFQVLLHALFDRNDGPEEGRSVATWRHKIKTAGHLHFLARKSQADA